MATDIKNDVGLSSNLVSYWEFEEASGTRVDSHGSNDLSDNNTVLQGTGLQGNCADFESSNDEFLTISDASQTDLDPGTSDFTIAFAVKWESHTTTTGLVTKGTTSGNFGYRIIWQTSSGGRMRMQTSSTGSSWTNADWSWSPVDGTWYYMAFVKSGSTVTWYRDAVSQTAKSAQATVNNNNQHFTIGSSASGTQANDMDGLIDELGFWKRALTSTEISDIYNSGSLIPYDAGGVSTPIFIPKVAVI